ncbi:acetyl-CoA synthase [Hydrogenophaga taeniospiralis CCUG 15921]|uniref:Acetyl-CoA synthase n=1 Tax=Hydrogenophaga taeniospiralis CCUG 15921 TaxID=1281780 RepID=A0A9X4NNH9_9BURK|nr:AMP-binding protein [Hydrogenophaga taeniospiralis]MDG5974575.1 acetyl-CoA synthase [Hydrogenophaga taeniospiralis CCUG 15921]
MPQSQGRDKTTPTRRPAAVNHYDALHSGFRWQVPDRFNMAEVCLRRWAAQPATAASTAVIACAAGQPDRHHSYAELQDQANRLSNALAAMGVERGDRVAIVLPQRFETAVAYMAVLQMGAVGMPLSQLFGPEALEYRLHDSEAVVAICDASTLDAVQSVSDACPLLRTVVAVGVQPARAGALDWSAVLAQAAPDFALVHTLADEAAVLIYTSGTTGNPKGALIPHRALIGNLTGFVCSQNWFGFDPFDAAQPSQAVFWSPADWAWTGGLMDALLPTLYFGRPIVGYNGRFSPQTAFELLERHGVTHSFLFPTALKAMMKAFPEPRQRYTLRLQAIMSAGEAVGDAVFAYCQQQLGVTVNEMFGQTEINYIVGNCAMEWGNAAAPGRPKQGGTPLGGSDPRSGGARGRTGWPAKPGSMGKGYPGHRVAVIDDEGNECPVGVPGDVAVHRLDVHGDPDPIFFLGYWKNEAATRAKFTGDMASSWCRTGDMAVRDADGYLWYQGRADDVFKAAGYRIGPGEIENCLVKHPAVANAAVVPKPDAERGAVVKAYVVLAQEYLTAQAGRALGDPVFEQALTAELQAHVKGKLAPYEYPKEIEFVDALPMTTTGKVQRRVLRLQEEERARARA